MTGEVSVAQPKYLYSSGDFFFHAYNSKNFFFNTWPVRFYFFNIITWSTLNTWKNPTHTLFPFTGDFKVLKSQQRKKKNQAVNFWPFSTEHFDETVIETLQSHSCSGCQVLFELKWIYLVEISLLQFRSEGWRISEAPRF